MTAALNLYDNYYVRNRDKNHKKRNQCAVNVQELWMNVCDVQPSHNSCQEEVNQPTAHDTSIVKPFSNQAMSEWEKGCM